MTIIYFILILGTTVFIHELGHFLFAKKAKIYVYEFSIGMGPRLFKFKRKGDETVYSIRLFPIGGFVQMAGEEIDEDDKIPKDQLLYNKTWLQRFLTIIAGVIFNFILAIIILFFYGLFTGSETGNLYIGKMSSEYTYPGNVIIGDQIVKINGKDFSSYEMFALELQTSYGNDITLDLKHSDNLTSTVTFVPIKNEDDTYTYPIALKVETESGFFPALKYAFTKFWNLIVQMIYVIWYLITGKLSLNMLSGPVGIFKIIGEASKIGFSYVVYLLALICINVGFINLLPLPAFDGGRVLFLIIEKIKGSPVSTKVENTIHTIGFILLMILMVLITYNDIVKIFF